MDNFETLPGNGVGSHSCSDDVVLTPANNGGNQISVVTSNMSNVTNMSAASYGVGDKKSPFIVKRPRLCVPASNKASVKPASPSSIVTHNKFSVLAQSDDENEMVVEAPVAHVEKPPPIYINNINNINTFISDMSTLNITKYRHHTIGQKLKVNFEAVVDFRKAVNYLQHSKAEFHTYQLKSEKNFRVVVRGLHPSCDTEVMMNELKGMGYEPTQMLPVLHPQTRQPLPLFFLDLKPNPKNPTIYALGRLYNAHVKVEPPKPKKSLAQCSKCQGYGHTKNYCHQAPRCVKCEADHPTEKCTKPVATPPTCTNCRGSHTANYKGCPVHKKLQSQLHLRLVRPTGTIDQDVQQASPNIPPPNRSEFVLDPLDFPAISAQQTNPRSQISEPVRPSYAMRTKQSPSADEEHHEHRQPQQTHSAPMEALLQKMDMLLSILQPLVSTLAQILPTLLKPS